MFYHQKLGERIADALREAIITGQHKPGERLREDRIAINHKTSRTPVREAFRQLEAEGLVEIRPRRGAVVAPITPKDIEDYYELQGLLTSYAAKRAVSQLNSDDLDKMEELVRELTYCHQGKDYSGMAVAHNQFYEVFVAACENDRIFTLVQNIINQFQRFSVIASGDESFDDFVRLHQEIIQAFRLKDTKQVETLIAENAGRSSAALLRKLQAL